MRSFSFSVSRNLTDFQPFTTDSLEEFAEVITEWNWAPAVYRDNYRNKANFLSTDILAFDIDDGLSLTDALVKLKSLTHIIATTKSHQKPKNGKVADRYRIVLFLESSITDEATYNATWHRWAEYIGAVDQQAKDVSRFFYPSKEVVSLASKDVTIVPIKPKPKEEKNKTKPVALTNEQKGKLARSTLEFLITGAEPGSWNTSLFKSAKDWYEQGYEKEDFIARAEMIDGYLDDSSMKTIESAFSKEPIYPPRASETITTLSPLVVKASDLSLTTFSYLDNKDLVKGEPTGLEGLDQLLGGGKRLGEVTALVAEGKTGKNALYHYLMHLWIRKNIPIAYASRELDPATEVVPDLLSMRFKESARLVALTEEKKNIYQDEMGKWLLYFADGRGYFPEKDLKDWVRQLKEKGVSYFWFDHLHWMLEDPEEYKIASLLSRQLSDIAKNQNIHIDIIIQPKILMDGQRPSLNSMKGGSAIGQNINNLLTLERVLGQKNISRLTLKAARSRLATLGEVYLQYDPTTLSFGEVEEETQAKPEREYEVDNVITPNWKEKMI